jgi:hypothetical protein
VGLTGIESWFSTCFISTPNSHVRCVNTTEMVSAKRKSYKNVLSTESNYWLGVR